MVFKCWMFALQTLGSLRCRKRGKLESQPLQPGQEVRYVTESHRVFNLFRQRWHQQCFRFTTDNGTRDFYCCWHPPKMHVGKLNNVSKQFPMYSISFTNISCIRSLGYASARECACVERWFFLPLGAYFLRELSRRQKSKILKLKYRVSQHRNEP